MSSNKTSIAKAGKVLIKKQPASPRTKKKKCVRNTFDIVQFKKMIGKGLIATYKGSTQNDETNIKDKILSGNIKSIAMTGFVSSGIIYIFNGVERLIALHSISYADIKKHDLDIDIIITQYSKLTPQDISEL
jgi:hypothetical protein